MVIVNPKKKKDKKNKKRSGPSEEEQEHTGSDAAGGSLQQGGGGGAAAAGPEKRGRSQHDEGGRRQQQQAETKDNLHFEDPFEDEFEDEEVVQDDDDMMEVEEEGEGDEGEQQGGAKRGGAASASMAVDEDDGEGEGGVERRVFRPGVDSVAEGEELEHDPSAYVLYHCLSPEWPCLSFDIVPDGLGGNRTRFPVTMYAVCGTQADSPGANKLTVMKMTELHKTQRKAHDSDDSDDDEEDSDDEDEGLDVDPVLDQQSVAHPGAVNRVRCMPQKGSVVASWSESGQVHVWDLQQHIRHLDQPGSVKGGGAALMASKPVFSFKGHRTEGWALDWSAVLQGQLASGDNDGRIHVWKAGEGGAGLEWSVDRALTGHTGSVEDLQWSPTEASVFISCSSDRSLRVWDTRSPKREAMLALANAHDGDVNVCSWNRNVAYLLASGSDDGSFKVWDLRKFQQQPAEPLARFQWHKGPITSIEWHPSDESILACASEDDQVTVWDLSVEKDEEAEAAMAQHGLQDLPPQLLFVHQGQTEVKELHFHPQVPGLIMTTASDGFNVFKPAI